MDEKDRAELAKFREQKRRRTKYANQFNEDHYRRLVCMYPIKRSVDVDMAMNQAKIKSVSAYLTSLIDRDLKERGLWHE